MPPRKVFLLCGLALILAGNALGQTYVELILDASGSMFNRLDDGRYRIVAAKEALADLIASLPGDDDLNVGLRVYGSRTLAVEEGACQDSELFVPLEGVQRQALLGTVRDTQARGATPIALSLERAMDDFPAEGRKMIVLVTDGEESCGGDVRSVVERLRSAGVGIELRILGFDLDDAAVRSFEGLGTFENTRNAAELAAALGRAVQLEPAARTERVTVSLTRDGAATSQGATVLFVEAIAGEEHRFSAAADGTLVADLPAGRYQARVADALSDSPLTVSGLAVLAGADNRFSFELAPEVQVRLTVDPAEPYAASPVSIRFEGAPAAGAIVLAPADADDDTYLAIADVEGSEGSVDLAVPSQPGSFEARYLVALPEGGDRVLGRSDPFTSLPISASLSAPREVPAGATIEVEWEGPNNPGDYVTIVPLGSPEGTWDAYVETEYGSPTTLTVSDRPGQYELRYVIGQDAATLATARVTVTAVSASLSAPREVPAGGEFAVGWVGPDNPGDYITVVPTGSPEGHYESYIETEDGDPALLTASDEPGEYEIRYVTGMESRTLASLPVTVTAVSATLIAPHEVGAGEEFEVEWDGPDNAYDYITVVPAGSPEGHYESYIETEYGSPALLTASEEPGNYEVRYVNGQSGSTLTSVSIRVR